MAAHASRRPTTLAAATGLAIWLCATAAAAQSVTATVNRPETTVHDPFHLSVTVSGTRGAEPTLPQLPDFDVHPRGTSTQMQIVNGHMSTSVVHTYILAPRRAGTFVVGPVTAQINGRVYQSRPFKVRVLPASAKPRGAEAVFVTAQVSKKNPVVSEQILYTFRFYRRARVAQAAIEVMTFDGFRVENLGEQREYETTVGGVEYVVTEVNKALFALEHGKITIPPAVLNAQVVVQNRRSRGFFDSPFDDMFGRNTRQQTLRTQPLELDVAPLPPAPPDFTGLVGSFSLVSQLSKASVKAGESTTLTISIKGTGNVHRIAEPPMPRLDGFKIYADKPTGNTDTSQGRVTGSKSFRTALVPLAAGTYHIPPITLAYFDTKAGIYRHHRTQAHSLEVLPADTKEELKLTEALAPTAGKVAVKILADDILPIYKRLDAAAEPLLRGRAAAGGWAGGLLLPPLLFVGLARLRRRSLNAEQSAAERRRRTALRRGLKLVGRVRSEAHKGESGKAAELASRGLRAYLGDKLGVEGGALTPRDVRECLQHAGAQTTLVDQAATLLERCEAAQYGAGIDSGNGAGSLDTDLRGLLKQLDRELRP